MAKYRKRDAPEPVPDPNTVEATQFDPKVTPYPAGCGQNTESETGWSFNATGEGGSAVPIKPLDWVVVGADGTRSVMDDTEFQTTYDTGKPPPEVEPPEEPEVPLSAGATG